MDLRGRAATQDDFDAFYEACFSHDRDNHTLRRLVEHEWRVLLEAGAGPEDAPATLTRIVEDRASRSKPCLVGCAQTAFVTDAFVREAREGKPPGVNVRVVRPLADNSLPFLSPGEIERANAGDGLNLLLTRWRRADWIDNLSDQLRLQDYMNREMVSLLRGYQVKEILIEVIGCDAMTTAMNSGFLLRADYFHPPLPPLETRNFLLGITRAEALHCEGLLINQTFAFTPPRLGLSRRHQKLALRALSGQKDEDIAAALYVSPAGVKNWWREIYKRIDQAEPELLPADSNNAEARGQEKRRVALRYLAERPEELRPYAS